MKQETTIDISPSTHLIQSLASQNLTYVKALCEFIDNALDAGATTVTIEFGKPNKEGALLVLISDNGEGCKSLIPLIRLGNHESHGKKRDVLGRYGIGAKDAMLWLGGVDSSVTVQSVYGGVFRKLQLRWMDLCRSESWTVKVNDIMQPERPAGPGEIGTQITVAPVIRRVPDGKDWDRLLSTLGYLYTPAIKGGKQIVVYNGRKGHLRTPLTRWTRPELEPGFVNETINVNGKQARVHVGIVQEKTLNDRPGITYFHGFRVIQSASSKGCGPYGIRRICGFVELSKEWTLNKNKDGVAKDEQALYDAVFDVCKTIFEKAECITQQLESSVMINRIESLINDVLTPPNTKAKRERGSSHGSKKPTGNGSKHNNATKTQSGTTFTKGLRGSIRFEMIEWPDSQKIGQFENGGSVLVNKSHPAVHAMIDARNWMGLAQVAIALIGSWYSLHPTDSRGQGLLRMDPNGDMVEQFAIFYGQALESATLDGQSIMAAVQGTTNDESTTPEINTEEDIHKKI